MCNIVLGTVLEKKHDDGGGEQKEQKREVKSIEKECLERCR